LFVNVSVNDSGTGADQVNVTLYNSTGNVTDLIPMSLGAGTTSNGYWNATIDTTTLIPRDGVYNISVNATDTAGMINISVINVSIIIDNTLSTVNISIVNPSNLTNFTNENILINLSANDTLSKVFNVTFKIYNSSTNATKWLDVSLNSGNIDQGYWTATISSTTLVNGYYNITVNVTDFAGNQVVENLSSFNVSAGGDATPPNVSIDIPAADTNFSGSFLVNASINDTESDVTDVNLSLLQPGSTAAGPISMNLSAGGIQLGNFNTTVDTVALGIADGSYNLSVNATDSTSNTNISANVSITIDNTPPNVSIDVPTGGIQSGSILINASVNDTTSKVFNTTFRLTTATGNTITDWLDATLRAEDITVGFWDVTFDTTTLADDVYNITINATDFAGNQNVTNISTIEIDNLPNATIINPLTNSNFSTQNFLVNVSANSSSIDIDFVNLTILNSTGNVTNLIKMTLGAGTATSGYWNTTIDPTTQIPRDGAYNLSVNATTQGTNTTPQ